MYKYETFPKLNPEYFIASRISSVVEKQKLEKQLSFTQLDISKFDN